MSNQRYRNVSELDKLLLPLPSKAELSNFFYKELREIEDQFKSGKFGPEWTLVRWLVVKVGVSRATAYRMIAELHRRIASEETIHGAV